MEQKKNIGIIIQARAGSTRLPQKVILDFYRGESILDIIIKKIQAELSSYETILATTESKGDDILVEKVKDKNIKIFRGSEEDVLSRFICAANKYKFTHIIRVCADNPFLDVASIKELLAEGEMSSFDYISFKNHKDTPVIKTHIGLFAEWVSLEALRKVSESSNEKKYREHVTNYIYEHPDKYKIKLFQSDEKIYKREDIRLTVDDFNDFENLRRLHEYLVGKKYTIEDLVNVIDKNQEIKGKMLENIKKYTK